ncbi:DUF2515 family protein [Aquibacillus rhizosphaerae]|uniref:DUF2515 family protein n=1 Tax=Aquibacillus rhizosphaerae TaxID=3051431 RepID=A0ABT7L4P8_9BACI|nr:DUF2515 family protein [Aquibacillus sp. LR5S19]MDL4840840.1 DUF2515 family protein [Aquibacillus sp. LR5S19]
MNIINKLETDYIHYIKKKTQQANKDNISRTMTYQKFYKIHPEIKWSFLASMVSRNAGWNMTDLKTSVYKSFLKPRVRKQLFSTYERANWLIFSDAYPQLLLYQISLHLNRPMFHLLSSFSVSTFMVNEWFHFWKYKNQQRLLTALIINEQNVIQSPVPKHPFYKHHVFMNWPYLLQDFFFMSVVLFPTRNGFIYATNVHDFTSLTKRIKLGKKLASILFHCDLYQDFYDFAVHTEHTGSRSDYQSYLKNSDGYPSPILRKVYPIITHQDKIRKDWFLNGGVKKKWWKPEIQLVEDNHWSVFCKKRKIINDFYKVKNKLKKTFA